VLGGFNATGGIVAAVQIFDSVTCTWSTGPDMPKPVHHTNAAVVDGTIYVVGAMETINFTAIPDVWAWNPATDAAWSTRTAMPAGTQRGSAVTGVIDGKIYVAGGLRAGAVSEVSMYDPVANDWTGGLPALPMTRDHGCGGVVGGKLYVLGGRQAAITSQSPIVYEFTPGAGWVERTSMPTARGGTACGVVGDRIVVVGGEGNTAVPSGVFPQTEAYDAATNTWETLAPMPMPRHGMGAAVVGNKVYVPGGANKQGFGAVATFEILTP
jgi:N-acetylneuraminic acid mutarotase